MQDAALAGGITLARGAFGSVIEAVVFVEVFEAEKEGPGRRLIISTVVGLEGDSVAVALLEKAGPGRRDMISTD